MTKYFSIFLLFGLFISCVGQRETIITTQKTIIVNAFGKNLKCRKILLETYLPCSADTIWKTYQYSDFTNAISKPRGKLKPKRNYKIPQKWIETKTDSFNLSIQGFIPFGSHYIFWEKIDHQNFVIQTRERGGFVSIWDNKIKILPTSDTTCIYKDELVIRAGILTKITAIWAKGFYKHRHKKILHTTWAWRKRG